MIVYHIFEELDQQGEKIHIRNLNFQKCLYNIQQLLT